MLDTQGMGYKNGFAKSEAVEITDLNILISTLKKREENVIQLLDYTMKYYHSKVDEERNQLRDLSNEIDILEKNRQQVENHILQKYIDLKVSEPKQKK